MGPLKKLPIFLAALILGAGRLGADASAEAVSPAAQAQASPVVSPVAPQAVAPPLSPSANAPSALSPSAGLLDGLTQTTLSPAAPEGAALSGTAGDPLPPEEVSDPLAMETPALDLGQLTSPVLMKLVRALGKASDRVWFDPDQQTALENPSPGAQSAAAVDLFAELNRRAGQGDKDAKQALDLAIGLHGDLRALPVAAVATPTSPSAPALSPTAQPTP